MALLLFPAAAASRHEQKLFCQYQPQPQYFVWIPRRSRNVAIVMKSLQNDEFSPSVQMQGDDTSEFPEVSSDNSRISTEDEKDIWPENSLSTNVPSSSEGSSSLPTALKRYLFVSPASDSEKRSKWVNRRSAVLVVQNSNNIEKALERVGEHMESSDMNMLVRRLAIIGRWDDACQLVGWMVKKNKATCATYSTYIIMLGRAGRPVKALQIYFSLTQELRHDPFIGNSILSALVNNWKISRAFKLFAKLKDEGFVPNAITYSTMFSACLKIHEGYEISQEILQEMKARDLKPDLYAYGSLLRVYCANGREQQAHSLVEEMKSQGVTLSLFHYSYLFNLYAHVNKPQEAEKLMLQMKAEGVQPNEVVYRSILRVYGRTGRIEQAKQIFDGIQKSGIHLDMVMYTAMMEAYVTVRQVYEAHELLLEMRRNRIRPGGSAYSLLIAGYGEIKDLEMINKLSLEIRDRRMGKQDIRLYNSLLKAYSQVQCDDGITNTLERMDFEGITADRGSFNILINHLCVQRMYALALRTFNDMKSRGLKPNMGTYSRLLSGLTTPLLETPQASSVSQLLTAAETSKQREMDLLDAAFEIFREMRARKVYCSLSALEKFTRANARARNWPLVMEALDCHEEAGFIITKDLFEFVLVQACDDCHYGSMREILSIVEIRGYMLSNECLEKAREVFKQLDHLKGVLQNLTPE